jgi:hypothetical protein
MKAMKALTKRGIIALMAFALLLAAGCAKSETVEEGPEEPAPDRSLVIGYAEQGVTVVEDPDALAKEVEEMLKKASEPGIALSYKNDAVSEDGINFSCYIANSPDNKYDAFVQIFADEAYQDEVFLSQLIRPGQAFESLTLEHELPKGDTRCYIAFTQVETVDGEQSVHAQTFFTMDFHVI